MKHVTVFMGSRFGKRESYKREAEEIGKILADNDLTLVYGGSESGIMGTTARSVKDNGGHVIGVYPKGHFTDELPFEDIDNFIEVDNMDERKRKLIDFADAYIILPGGIGTLEEFTQLLCEMMINITPWKPIYILNTDGFYTGLGIQLSTMVDENFSYNNKNLAKNLHFSWSMAHLKEKLEEL